MEASAKTLTRLKKTLLTMIFTSNIGDSELPQVTHLPPGPGINQKFLLPLFHPFYFSPGKRVQCFQVAQKNYSRRQPLPWSVRVGLL